MTQGFPLSTNIFNVVVDTVVRHWESFLADRAGGDRSNDDASQPSLGRTIRASDDRRQQKEEGHTRMKVKA